MAGAPKKNERYTYQDYLSWPEEERWELIDGVAFSMVPAPSTRHQKIVWKLSGEIYRHLAGQDRCQGFSAPTDVVLDEFNVVQPDLFVVCDQKKISEQSVNGAPDLVIEVVSPATEVKDRREKRDLYERFGVQEYILIFPEREYAERYVLKEGSFSAPEIINWDETLEIAVLGLDLKMWEIFERQRPD